MAHLAIETIFHPHDLRDIATLDKAQFTAICIASCKRLPAMRRMPDVRRLDQFVAAGAWTDATLALIAIELPDWHLRRLVHDEGEWHCALSKQPDLPEWLDDAAEAHHPDIAMALLSAFRTVTNGQGHSHLTAVKMSSPPAGSAELMSCENYA